MDRKTARRVIKALVWQNLQGNWLKAFGILIIQMLILTAVLNLSPVRIPLPEEIVAAVEKGSPVAMLFFPKGITTKILTSLVVTAALYVIISCPLSTGINRFFLSVARGEKAKISEIFVPFTSLKVVFSSIWLNVLVMLVSTFWGAIFALIPAALMVIATYFQSSLVAFAAITATYAMMFLTLLWTSRYTLAVYIFAEGELGPFKSLHECIKLMNYRSGESMIFRASYLGWDLLASVVAPMKFVYQPLFGTGYAKYLYYIRGDLTITETTRNNPNE